MVRMRALIVVSLLGVACSGEDSFSSQQGGSGGATEEPGWSSGGDSSGGADVASGGGVDDSGGSGGELSISGSGGTASGGASGGASSGGESSGGAPDSSGGSDSGGSPSGGATSGGSGSGGGSATLTLAGLHLPAQITEGECWEDSTSTGCEPIPVFDPPIFEWSGCDDQSQAIIRVPPGTCAQVYGYFEQSSAPDCSAYSAATCSSWDYATEDTKIPSGWDETLTLYINRRRDCGVQWNVVWYAGDCPSNP